MALPAVLAKRTWAGFAVKTQGHGVFAGWGSTVGTLWNLDDPEYRQCTFVSKFDTLGLAGGGRAEAMLVFFLNVGSLGNIEGQEFGNGGNFHFDVPLARVKKLIESLQRGYKLAKLTNDWVELATGAAELYRKVSQPKNTVVAVPAADAGVMVGYTYAFGGTIDIRSMSSRTNFVDDL